MFDSRNRIVRAALVSCAVVAAATAVAAQAQAQAKQPRITARPHSVMVRATATLKGSGFPANTVVQLEECGRTFWIDPSDPCIAGEETVTTDRNGRFHATFQVGLCPEGESGKMPTERTCYIGELVNGEDTGSLVGAAKITVTYP
jgi:hypothetical protein